MSRGQRKTAEGVEKMTALCGILLVGAGMLFVGRVGRFVLG